MKNILSRNITVIILLIVTVISLGLYTYMLARPISYEMSYRSVTESEYGTFEGTMIFYADKTMVNKNTNFVEVLKSRYYYKGGYVFFTNAVNDEQYKEEVAEINKNFDKAINTPFYAEEINAFRLVVTEGDGYMQIYTCESAIIFAIVGGIVELLLIALTGVSVMLYIKKKKTI